MIPQVVWLQYVLSLTKDYGWVVTIAGRNKKQILVRSTTVTQNQYEFLKDQNLWAQSIYQIKIHYIDAFGFRWNQKKKNSLNWDFISALYYIVYGLLVQSVTVILRYFKSVIFWSHSHIMTLSILLTRNEQTFFFLLFNCRPVS
jgi:hypothetical protein